MKNTEQIKEAAEQLFTRYARSTEEPGQCAIKYDPETDQVGFWETFSGDNSWTPGDKSVNLLYSDVRESNNCSGFEYEANPVGEWVVGNIDWPVNLEDFEAYYRHDGETTEQALTRLNCVRADKLDRLQDDVVAALLDQVGDAIAEHGLDK